ncbi:MAG: amidohydrolase [Clostridiales Family XIII bacterium]|jgi:predicted amidohydrolase YtcJ|nr:amidohydrolase [Clostridiales Family XIII bacterium]
MKKTMAVVNARVYTVDGDVPWCEAFLVEGERIVRVGTDAEIRAAAAAVAVGAAAGAGAGAGVEMVDAGGRLILPGFIDAHCHPCMATYSHDALDVFSCVTEDEYVQTIRKFAEAHPERAVIKGCGWNYSDFPGGVPHNRFIDAAVPDRPVLIVGAGLHEILLNAKAIEYAGLSDDMIAPPGGVVGKDADGRLTGYFMDSAVPPVLERLPMFTPEEYRAGIQHFMKEASSAGITAVGDAAVGVVDETGFEGYGMIAEGEFPMKVFLSEVLHGYERHDAASIRTRVETRAAVHNNSNLELNTVKFFIDGTPESNTAVMEAPYLDEPDNAGTPTWDIDAFDAAVRASDGLGYRVEVHAMGDRAVRYAVDAIEGALRTNGMRDARHMIAHLQFVNEADKDRMAANGIIAVPTSLWFEKGDMYYKIELFNVGRERADGEYPMKGFFDRGILVACGSDAPVALSPPVNEVSYAPLQAIQQGVLRCSPLKDAEDQGQNVINPAERVSLAQMIEAYTINGARAHFAEGDMGSIRPGKLANFIVLDKDIFEIPVSEIYLTNVLETWYKGVCVHRRCES